MLFDATHTIIDPDPPSARVYAEIGARHGHEVTEAGLREALRPLWWSLRKEKAERTAVSGTSEDVEREWWRTLVDRAFQGCGAGGVSEPCFADIFEHFGRGKGWVVFPEVPGLIQALRERGTRACVVSNFDGRLHGVLGDLGLAGAFDAVIVSSEVGWEKPRPEIYRAALAALGVEPAEALMVGDDWEHDVSGPEAVGIRGVWLRREGRPEPRPHIGSLVEILPMLA